MDWLVLSDAIIVADTRTGIEAITDLRVDAAVTDLQAAVRKSPIGSAEQLVQKQHMVRVQRAHRNVPGGYWVAASDPETAREALTGSWPASEVERLAVLSDGAGALVTYQLADWRRVLDILEEHGPAELIRQTRAAEVSDPDGTRWPRFKTSDDATAAFCSGIS